MYSNDDQFSGKRQFGHNDDWFIGQSVASNQVLLFPCVLVLLPLDNLPSKDCTFYIEDGESVIFHFFFSMDSHHIVERPDFLLHAL
jgi:hypothetical protein